MINALILVAVIYITKVYLKFDIIQFIKDNINNFKK